MNTIMGIKNENKDYAGAGIRTLVDLHQQVLSLSPLAARTPPLMRGKEIPKQSSNIKNAPTGIRTRVFGSKGRNDWPDYTIGANNTYDKTRICNGPNGIRTHDIPVMSRALYLAKLWAQKAPSTGLEPVTNRLTAERSTY